MMTSTLTPTRKLNAHHLVDEANMADAATSSNRGRKRRLTDSAWKRKKKETNALINKSRVYVGEEYDRCPTIKRQPGGILFTTIGAPRTRVI